MIWLLNLVLFHSKLSVNHLLEIWICGGWLSLALVVVGLCRVRGSASAIAKNKIRMLSDQSCTATLAGDNENAQSTLIRQTMRAPQTLNLR